MNLKAVKSVLSAVGIATLMAACGGGGGSGSTSTGGVYYTHAQLAAEFVKRAFGDANIDAQLVKTNTEQNDYIVIYDKDYKTYDAYYLGNYNVGENVYDYIARNNNKNYYDLDTLPNNRFQDYSSGITFEETSSSSKNMGKLLAVKQALQIKKAASKIKAEFGLSDVRSLEVAKLSNFAATHKLTAAQSDTLTQQLMGTSVVKAQSAIKAAAEGNTSGYNAMIVGAAKLNGVGPEHMNKIVSSLLK